MKAQLRKVVRDIMQENVISQLIENDPCWKDYEMVGMKMKDGKEVPNCVPKNESSINEIEYKDAVEKFNADLMKNSQVERIAKFHKKSIKDVVKALQPYIKVLRYNDKSVKVISIDFRDTNSEVKVHVSQTYKQNESVNEAVITYGIEYKSSKNDRIFKKASLTKTTHNPNIDKMMITAISKDAKSLAKQDGWVDYRITKDGVPVKESVNEAATDRDFEKVYSIFDKKDYFGIKGSIKTMLGNWQRALDKGDKGAQQYSKEDIIDSVTAQTKARAKHTYDELVNAINKKDIKSLKSKLRHDQPFSLMVFAQVTGKKLPKSTRDIHSFLDNEFMNESVNESASKEAMGIAALTGTRGSAVQDFIDKHELDAAKLFKSIKTANLKGRLNFVSALVGKDGNPNQRLTIKLHKKN